MKITLRPNKLKTFRENAPNVSISLETVYSIIRSRNYHKIAAQWFIVHTKLEDRGKIVLPIILGISSMEIGKIKNGDRTFVHPDELLL